jgi:hypothetical protein
MSIQKVLVRYRETRGVFSKSIFLHSRHAESVATVPSFHRPPVYRFGEESLLIVTTVDGRRGRKIGGQLAPRIHPSLGVSRNWLNEHR